MCYTITIIKAEPDYKRPSVDIDIKQFQTIEEIEEYKKQYEQIYRENIGFGEYSGNGDLDHDTYDIWKDDDDELSEYIYSDSYMEIPPIECIVKKCLH